MPPSREHGRAVPVTAIPLPELVFDLTEGGSLPSPAGKTETPLSILPELVFDMRVPEPAPTLQLTVYLRTQATPGEAALDLLQFVAAVNQLDLSFRGRGLSPDDVLCEATPTGERMRVVLKPMDSEGAAERLARLAEAINGPASPAVPGERLKYRSIERCEAEVLPSAA